MKTLTIFRHAKTEPHRPGDFDRALVERGIADAQTMGRYANEKGYTFDYVLSSPARRTTQTIELFRKAYGEAMPLPEYEADIYDASLGTLTNIVRNLPDSADRVILCGHNPSMQALTLTLAKVPDDLMDQVREKFPTASLAVLELRIERWGDIARYCGELTDFETPRGLKDEAAEAY